MTQLVKIITKKTNTKVPTKIMLGIIRAIPYNGLNQNTNKGLKNERLNQHHNYQRSTNSSN